MYSPERDLLVRPRRLRLSTVPACGHPAELGATRPGSRCTFTGRFFSTEIISSTPTWEAHVFGQSLCAIAGVDD